MRRRLGELLAHECDLVFGEAIAANIVAGDEELTGKLLYSRPYYRTGYMLVERKNGPHVRTLAELKGQKSQRLGTEAGSVADYILRQRGYLRRLYRNQLATLRALNDGDIDHAYLWSNVGWALHTTPEWDLQIVGNDTPVDYWDIAIAMDRGDQELNRQVDSAVESLIKDGTVGAHWLVTMYVTSPRCTNPRPAQRVMRENRSATKWLIEGLSRRCKRCKRRSGLIPRLAASDLQASWWWVWIKITFPIRRLTPSHRALTTRLPNCSQRSWELDFGFTGLIRRTTPIRRSYPGVIAMCC